MTKLFKITLYFICINLFLSSFAVCNSYITYTTDAPSVVINIKGESLTFLIDTGFSDSIIPFRTIKKLGIDKTKEFFEFTSISFDNEQYNEKKAELETILEELGLDNYKQYISPNKKMALTFHDVCVGSEQVEELLLVYDEKYNNERVESVLEYDGILGMNNLLKFKKLTIDYKKKRIIFNSKKLLKTLPINICHEIPNRYGIQSFDMRCFVRAKIKGDEYNCLLDTGNTSGFLMIPAMMKSIFTNDDYNGSPFYIDLELGNKAYRKIKAVYSDNDDLISLFDYDKFADCEVLYLGSSIFKNHIIQFDFENNTFGIE
jgi:predicted aspartyl protease